MTDMANRPRPTRPPPLVPKPGQVKVVQALFRYDAQQADELSFDEGDLLYILDMTNTDWWKAKCGKQIGLIPSNYVSQNTESIDYPLHEAAKRGNMDFMTECISNKVSVNGLDKAGSTPLHWAAHGGHMECIKCLLNVANCQLDVKNKLGDTPLHSGAWKNHADVVQILINIGANPNIRNNENKLPVELAKDPQTTALLREAAGNRSVRYDDGYVDEEDSD